MRKTVLILFLVLSGFSAHAADAEGSNGSNSSGISTDDTRASVSVEPRLVRENPVPQVFFEEGGSAYISTASMDAYNRVMRALNVALRTHTKAKLLLNKRTNTIIDADGPIPSEKINVYDDSEDNTSVANKNANSAPAAPGSGPAATAPAAKPTGH